MKTNPIYVFEDGSELGINLVPIAGFVMVRKIAPDNRPMLFTKLSNTGMINSSTVDDFLAIGALYDEFAQDSELEKIEAWGITSWGLLGRDPANYNPGDMSVDFSQSSSPTHGATGAYSFAGGSNTTALGLGATAFGLDTLASRKGSAAFGIETIAPTVDGSIAFGQYNGASVGTGQTIFEVGMGTSNANRLNAFEVETCGRVNAPLVTPADINVSPSSKVLITKEYLDFGYYP